MSPATVEAETQHPDRNPYVFVAGCPRSGTTLLERIVNAHRELAVFHELRWPAHIFERREGLTADGMVTPELIGRLEGDPALLNAGIGRRELEELLAAEGPVPYARFVGGIFDLYGRRQGKRLVGDKTPFYAVSMPTLHALWPRARVVHLIRDGRSVCLSVMRRRSAAASNFATWNEDPVTTTALWWEWRVRSGRQSGARLGPTLYYDLRYEALVADPAAECAKLCAFLGLPYDEGMLRFHQGRTRAEPGSSTNAAWLPVTPGLQDWRAEMPADAVERFEAAAGGLLEELGYPRAVPRPRPVALEHAARIRDPFTGEIRARGQPLPGRW